jgi:hypothetical protein
VQETSSADEVDHYFVGLTQQSSAGGLARLRGYGTLTLPASRVYPMGTRFREFVQPIARLLHGDQTVREVIMRPVLGRYGISQELSVGLEVRAAPGFNAAALAASVFHQAHAAAQTDSFIGRVLPPDEWTDNARPGLTVLFKEPRRIASTTDLVRQIIEFPGDGWAIDGFTTIPAADSRIGIVQGLRYIFLPEISIRWDLALRERLRADEEEIEVILLDQATRIGRLCQHLLQDPSVALARLNWFDVIVAGIEDYQDVIVQLARERGARAANPQSMTRKAFSEILHLTSAGVLHKRLDLIERGEASQRVLAAEAGELRFAGLRDACARRSARWATGS